MNQFPRRKSSSASSGASPWSQPGQTTNERDDGQWPPSTSVPEGGLSSGKSGRSGTAAEEGQPLMSQQQAGQARDGLTKLNQIVQNYFIKAALIIVQSRTACPPAYNKTTGIKRVNKWFNVEIDETDVFRDDWRTWKNCDSAVLRPPPMLVEVYIDMTHLTNSQSLVIIDDQGKRWNVSEALNASGSSGRGGGRPKTTEVVLERWTVNLGVPPQDQLGDLNAILPVVYKKSIVLFRSLYTYSKFLPSWKFAKRLSKQQTNHGALKLKCRVFSAEGPLRSMKSDPLNISLLDGADRTTEDFSFGSTESPAGSFSVNVAYRTNCDFRVDDSEAILSSHFMGVDEHFFRPSLDAHDSQRAHYGTAHKEIGSLPTERKETIQSPDRSQAYGSLSTFHQVGPPTGTSPISALRAARDLGTESTSPSPPIRVPPQPRAAPGTRSSLRSAEGVPGVARRPSVSFMPFKTPSLSASPSQPGQIPSSPRSSLGRVSAIGAWNQARNRTSLELQSPPTIRDTSMSPDNAVAFADSPKPASAPRYSSSFGHRRGRLSSGGGSKNDDDNNSSGRASQTSSSAQPGSGMLTEGATGASSESIQKDDDNISAFLKMLDTKKNLKSFEAPGDAAGVGASSKRTSAALSKFQRMRDSNAALSDSMSSSLLLHRSSSSSSRQLSSVPPMVAGTSLSTSSSPGKPISPHTPHTPAIPSRLSANSVAEYAQPHRSRSNTRPRTLREERESFQSEDRGEEESRDRGSTAIDIPTSPRPYLPHVRRASSVAQQHRALQIEDETGDLIPYGMRSASLGADDRPPLSLSALLRLNESSEAVIPTTDVGEDRLQPADNAEDTSLPMSRQPSSSFELGDGTMRVPRSGAVAASAPYRPRIGRPGGRGQNSPQGSVSSLTGDRGSGSVGSDRPTTSGRYSFTRQGNFEEDEPLLFAMSEIGGQYSRRSLEEGRGGSNAAASDRGGGDSASSSRRGSRRGGQWG
ncbi:MAG: autophagy protein 13 [Piccolia ochrophora]|nr:MAG: autophagy protein 13 [Piccolia ochrophora]